VFARAVLMVLAFAAALRLAFLAAPRFWYDEVTTGLLGLLVLRGELPVYFLGQPFMGALDGYLQAALFAGFGVSIISLKLLPVLVSVASLGLLVRLTWEGFGPRAALFAALIQLVPPDFALRWSHEARNHYPLTLLFGTLALLLALRAPAARPGPASLRFAVLGVVLGLAFWTNFLAVAYGLPVLVLVLRRGLSPVWPAALAAGPGLVLGSLPHWLYGLPHGTALPPAGDWLGLAQLGRNLGGLARVTWPILAGVPEPWWGTPAGLGLGAGLAVLYGGVIALGLRRRPAGPPAASLAWALLVLTLVTVGLGVGTQYGRGLEDRDPRYLLPLYTALPALLGLGLARLPGRLAAPAVAGVLLTVQVAGALAGEFQAFRPAVIAASHAVGPGTRDLVATIERGGIRHFYSEYLDLSLLTLLSRERVIVSDHYQESYPGYARAVDGAAAAGWWTGRPSPTFETNLAAVGARFTFRTFGPIGGAYVDFALPPIGLRELDPERLAATASVNSTAAGWVLDRTAATLWSTGAEQRGGEWLRIDLGEVVPVAMLRWLPGHFQEVPAGLTLEVSRDDTRWTRLLEVPEYQGPLFWSAGHPMARVRAGRVELRVPPTPARYLRVGQTGSQPRFPWTIRELFVYAATDAATPAPATEGAVLARAVRAYGVTRLYADLGWGARVALAAPEVKVPPGNLFLDAAGFVGAARDFLPRFRWRPGTGVLLEPVDAAGFAATARAAGLAFDRHAIGDLVLFVPVPVPAPAGRPVPHAEVSVTTSVAPERAARAVDGDLATHWGTGRPQAPGDWVRIDLARPRALAAVRLVTTHELDWPRGPQLEGSPDGLRWEPLPAALRTAGPLRWGGFALLRDGVTQVRLEFPAVTLAALRVVLTRGDPESHWSIHELEVEAATK
jgi:hypothetical protein